MDEATKLTSAQRLAKSWYAQGGITSLLKALVKQHAANDRQAVNETAAWAQDTLPDEDWAVFNGAHYALLEYRTFTGWSDRRA